MGGPDLSSRAGALRPKHIDVAVTVEVVQDRDVVQRAGLGAAGTVVGDVRRVGEAGDAEREGRIDFEGQGAHRANPRGEREGRPCVAARSHD